MLLPCIFDWNCWSVLDYLWSLVPSSQIGSFRNILRNTIILEERRTLISYEIARDLKILKLCLHELKTYYRDLLPPGMINGWQHVAAGCTSQLWWLGTTKYTPFKSSPESGDGYIDVESNLAEH